MVETTHPLKNLQGLNVCEVNPELWRKLSRSKRSFDL